MGLRSFTPMVIACPGCGRTTSTYFQSLAERIQSYLRESMLAWRKRYPGVETMQVAVMGCVVNGPGESKMANVGISLPGTGETPVAPVFVDGVKTVTLKGDRIARGIPGARPRLRARDLRRRRARRPSQTGTQDHRRQGGCVKAVAMANALQAVRGMNDVLPDASRTLGALRGHRARGVRAIRLSQHPRADRRADARCSSAASASTPMSSSTRCTRSRTS